MARLKLLSTMVSGVEARITTLRNEINRHNHAYYVCSQPTISDAEYDLLMSELIRLEEEHSHLISEDSPTQRVGQDKNDGFEQVEHRYPMLSLSNTYNYQEVEEWYRRVSKDLGEAFEVCAEIKYDGLSISLVYEDGKLVRAITRGDGVSGDDVTANVRTIRSIPLTLMGDYPRGVFEIRGEVLLPYTEFARINKEREENGEALFANPRNAASGTLKQLDPQIVSKRRLDAYLYHIPGEIKISDSHYEQLKRCAEWGFKVSPQTVLCRSYQDIIAFLDKWDKDRQTLPVATDGVVLKVNSITQQDRLGYTSKSPRWAIAYKFSAERSTTVLQSVDYQVGRTGVITPVANLRPVAISGTIVKRASLHNADFIASLDLHIGDVVGVEKGGEIIPKIVSVDITNRPPEAQAITFPKVCPACGTLLIRVDGEVAYTCPNEADCIPQKIGQIEHYTSRKATDMRIGKETAELLVNCQLVKSIPDLYRLTMLNLLTLPGFQRRSAQKLLQSIANSRRTTPYPRVLYGLSIRYVGETVAKTLAKAFPSIDLLARQTVDDLCAIPDIGTVIAQSVVEYFSSEENRLMIEELKALGVQLEVDEAQTAKAPESDLLANQSFVITGTFTHHSREEYRTLIERYGGKVLSSVSGSTNYLLSGEKVGPSKLQKATQLGVTILIEEDFLRMIGQEPPTLLL